MDLPRSPTWTHPKSNLWVASRSGEQVGRVELVSEHFNAFDSAGVFLGVHPDLYRAQKAVSATASSEGAQRVTPRSELGESAR